MIISIASDHAGFEQKQLLAAYLEEKGYEVHDLGPDSDDRVDYPDFAAKVAHEVAGGVATYGVLVCGTGIGMAVAANKINGIRAVNAINTQFAELCRERRRGGKQAHPRRVPVHRFRRRPPRGPRREDYGARDALGVAVALPSRVKFPLTNASFP